MYVDGLIKKGDGDKWQCDFQRKGENGDCLASCMQMTWFCEVNIKRGSQSDDGHFVEGSKRRSLKGNRANSKMMALVGEEELVCEREVLGTCLGVCAQFGML